MYRIYGKSAYDKKFRPLDLKMGWFVTNLIYASLIDTKEQADEICEYLNRENPKMIFEVRRAD